MGTAGDLFGGSGTSDLDLVAGENLTVGDAVSLGIDGKAYKSIGLLNNSGISSPLPLATTTRYHIDTVANKIIALGVSSTSTTSLYTSVGTVSASGALTWGTVTTHTMGAGIGDSITSWDAVRQSTNQLMLVYTDNSFIRARIVEYSGTTTTVGTEVTTTATNVISNPVINLVADSSGRVLIAWFRNFTTFTLWGARATVSGTTITLGTETQITLSITPVSTFGDQRLEMLYDSTQDRAVILATYLYSGPQLQTDLVLVDFSSTVSTVATSSRGNHGSLAGTLIGSLSRLSGTSSYLYRRCLSNTTTNIAAFTVSTTAFTLGTEITLTQNANTVQNTNWVEDTVNNKIIFGFGPNGCAVYTRSGTTLTLESTDTNIDFNQVNLNFFSPYVVGSFSSLQQIYDFSGVIPRQVGTLSIYTSALTSQARLLTSTSGISYVTEREAATKASYLSRNFIAGKITNENQIGISTQTVSSGATAKIRLRFNKSSPAKMVTGLSGLTPAAHYYVNARGIRELAGVTYLGYAKSATELVLANPSGAEN